MPFTSILSIYLNPFFTNPLDSNIIRTIFPGIISAANNIKLIWIIFVHKRNRYPHNT